MNKFIGGEKTRKIVARESGEVVGEITESGNKVVRYPHTDSGTPTSHWNLENKSSGLNTHVIIK